MGMGLEMLFGVFGVLAAIRDRIPGSGGFEWSPSGSGTGGGSGGRFGRVAALIATLACLAAALAGATLLAIRSLS